MNYNIITSSYFDVAAKRLAKKYPSFKDDLRTFRDELLENPLQGDELGLLPITLSLMKLAMLSYFFLSMIKETPLL